MDLNNRYAQILNKIGGDFTVYQRKQASGEAEWCLTFEGDSQDIWEATAIVAAKRRIERRMIDLQKTLDELKAREDMINSMIAQAGAAILDPFNDINNVYGAILNSIGGDFFVRQRKDPDSQEGSLWFLSFHGEPDPETSSWSPIAIDAAKNRIVEKLGQIHSAIEEISAKIESTNKMLADAQAVSE